MSLKGVLTVREALLTVLDHVDYMKGACAPIEIVCAALPVEIINLAREALDPPCRCTGEGPNNSSMTCPRHADNRWEK